VEAALCLFALFFNRGYKVPETFCWLKICEFAWVKRIVKRVEAYSKLVCFVNKSKVARTSLEDESIINKVLVYLFEPRRITGLVSSTGAFKVRPVVRNKVALELKHDETVCVADRHKVALLKLKRAFKTYRGEFLDFQDHFGVFETERGWFSSKIKSMEVFALLNFLCVSPFVKHGQAIEVINGLHLHFFDCVFKFKVLGTDSDFFVVLICVALANGNTRKAFVPYCGKLIRDR